MRSPIGAGTAELWLAACWAIRRRPGLQEGEKGREKNSYGGVWYRFYGNSPNNQTGPQDGRAVLQLHPALDLLLHGPVCSRVQMP